LSKAEAQARRETPSLTFLNQWLKDLSREFISGGTAGVYNFSSGQSYQIDLEPHQPTYEPRSLVRSDSLIALNEGVASTGEIVSFEDDWGDPGTKVILEEDGSITRETEV